MGDSEKREEEYGSSLAGKPYTRNLTSKYKLCLAMEFQVIWQHPQNPTFGDGSLEESAF